MKSAVAFVTADFSLYMYEVSKKPLMFLDWGFELCNVQTSISYRTQKLNTKFPLSKTKKAISL